MIENRTRILLGRKDGEPQFLSKHSWDCNWYWGFGYMGNRNSHWHFESLLKDENGQDLAPGKNRWRSEHDKNRGYAFEDSWMTQAQWWILRDLFIQAYALRRAADSYQYGGHQTDDAAPYRVTNAEMQAKLNADLGALLDRIWSLVNEWHEAAFSAGVQA